MKVLSKNPSEVLGLTFDGGILNAVELKRSSGSVQILKQVTAPLALDPLRDEPDLVGREIRNLLNGARIPTRRCVVGIPAGWALTLHTTVPGMEAADVASFLEIEAERGFACHVDELQIASKVYPSGAGEAHATLMGVPRGYLDRLEAVLAGAQLKPVSLSPGLLALPGARTGAITAEITESAIHLLLSSSAGVAALRAIEGAFDDEGAEKRVRGELLARELRITLGQLSPEVRQSVRQLNVFGERRFADQLLRDLNAQRRSLDLRARHVSAYEGPHHGLAIHGGPPVSAALSLGAQFLSHAEVFEFLRPRPTVWEQLASKYSSRRLAAAGAAAAVILTLLGGAFLYQEHQLSTSRSQWEGMRAKVAELEELQNNARRFRPWQNTGLGSMNIMRGVTEAFPEDAAVSARIIEIRNGSAISCTGTAKDNQSLLKTIDRLRGSPHVRDLRVDQVRGKAPLQFTVNFQWSEVASHEN